MAKYAVDLDALNSCLELISDGKINGDPYIYLQNIQAFIQRFPKYKIEEVVDITEKIDVKINPDQYLLVGGTDV